MKASIIIRAYNSEDSIRRSVHSAINQDFPKNEYEIIIINDGSTDNTVHILKEYNRVHNLNIISLPNRGSVQAANIGIQISRGKYIVLLDSDDYFLPILLTDLSSSLDMYPDIDFVYPDYWEEFKNKKKRIIPRTIFDTLAGGTLFKRKSLIEAGLYRKEVLLAEYDLFLRMIGKWKGFHYSKPLFVYCRRINSISANQQWLKKAINQLLIMHPSKKKQISSIRSYALLN